MLVERSARVLEHGISYKSGDRINWIGRVGLSVVDDPAVVVPRLLLWSPLPVLAAVGRFGCSSRPCVGFFLTVLVLFVTRLLGDA